jgi:hypothetical protein
MNDLRGIEQATASAIAAACLAASCVFTLAPSLDAAESAPVTVTVFEDAAVHFSPDSTAKYETEGVAADENGRIARTVCQLPELAGPHRITALVTVKPVPKTDREAFDRWTAPATSGCTNGRPDLRSSDS